VCDMSISCIFVYDKVNSIWTFQRHKSEAQHQDLKFLLDISLENGMKLGTNKECIEQALPAKSLWDG
jgi:hypothetical protein